MRVTWQPEEGICTLDGEDVLHWRINLPRVEGEGRSGVRVGRFYARVAALWRERWRKRLYWQACLDLARCRVASRPFVVWYARLEGGEGPSEDGVLCLRFTAQESRGEDGADRVTWEDRWDGDGWPAFHPPGKRKKVSR